MAVPRLPQSAGVGTASLAPMRALPAFTACFVCRHASRHPRAFFAGAGLVFPLLGRRAVGEVLYQRVVVTDEKTDDGRFTHQGANVFIASVRLVLAEGGSPQ